MRVNYQPSLWTQIKIAAAVAAVARDRPMVVRLKTGRFVERVDPQTRTCTGEPQQFRKSGSTVTILPKSQWVEDPEVLDVDFMEFR